MKLDEMTKEQFKDYVNSLNECEWLMPFDEVTYKGETNSIENWVNRLNIGE